MSKSKKRVKNNVGVQKKVLTNPPLINSSGGFFIDVTFEGLYFSVKTRSFTNYLKNSDEFIEKFKELRQLIKKLQNKNFVKDLILSDGMRHCHLIEKEKRQIVLESIRESLKKCESNLTEQDYESELFGEEKIYQIGFEGDIRLIGTYDECNSIFRIYLIDFHHKLYPDERKNEINRRNYKYCLMSS